MTQLTSNFEWLKQLGTPGGDNLGDTAFDSAGNLYPIGTAYGLFGRTNPSSNSWITKYDTGGNRYDSGTYFNLRFAAKILTPAKVPKIVDGSGTGSEASLVKELLIAIASLAHSANKLAI